MRIIGLTGGIGSGKSTVAGFLAEFGAEIMELDRTGHEVLKQQDVREKLVGEFGEDILGTDGEIDRARLAKIVFNDSDALSRLNRITHPVIDAVIEARVEKCRLEGVEVVVLEAAALLDAGRGGQADEIWVTVAPEDVVLKRLADRAGYSGEEIKARIRSQISNEERIRQADVVIDTDCSLEELRDKVEAEWRKLQARL
jgi:dephospho-CoA kinase